MEHRIVYHLSDTHRERIGQIEAKGCEINPDPKLARFHELWYDHWLAEGFHLMLGVLSIAGIGIVLRSCSGKTLPLDLPLGLTLGAVVSILGALAKYALAVPLDQCLGSQKWLWFKDPVHPKPLLDFERFDDASRSPVSAFGLLLRVRHRSMASLGAILVLLSLTVDPFLQQIVDFSIRAGTENQGTVPRVTSMTEQALVRDNGVEAIGSQSQLEDAAISVYLNSSAVKNVSITCPNTECSWPLFDTLALCSSCQDVTDQLDFGCQVESGDWKLNYTIQDAKVGASPSMSCGWFLKAAADEPVLMTGYTANDSDVRTPQALLMRQLNLRDPITDRKYWNGSLRFSEVPNPLANFAIVASSNVASIYANMTPSAHECVVHLCIRSIAATYTQGIYHERVVSEHRNSTVRPEPLVVTRNSDGALDYQYTQNFTITPPGLNQTFFVSNYTMVRARFTFDRIFPNYLTVARGRQETELRYFNDISGEAVSSPVDCNRWLIPGGVEASIKNITDVWTTTLRNMRWGEPVFGTGKLETYVHVRWEYFSVPLIIMALTAVLFCITVMQTMGAPCSNRSSLFTLMHGLSSDESDILGASASMAKIRVKAKETLVYLSAEDKEKRLKTTSRRKS